MKAYIGRRVLMTIPTLIAVSLLTFFLISLVPGDPAAVILGQGATGEQLETLRKHMGLDDPPHVRYGRWVKDLVTLGDLGDSQVLAGQSISKLIKERFPVTLNLVVYTMVFSLAVGIPFGTIMAIRHDTWVDYLFRVISVVGLSVPVFWLGLLILLLLVREFQWTPPIGWINPFEDPWGNFKQVIWPVVTLGYFQVSFIARMTRSSLLEVLSEDYMRTARAKGLKEQMVVVRHGLRNAMIPVLTIGGLQLVSLLGGMVITEKVFNLAGWGTLLIDGVVFHDFPVVQSMLFIFAAIVIVINLFMDLLYAWLDPRIRYG